MKEKEENGGRMGSGKRVNDGSVGGRGGW